MCVCTPWQALHLVLFFFIASSLFCLFFCSTAFSVLCVYLSHGVRISSLALVPSRLVATDPVVLLAFTRRLAATNVISNLLLSLVTNQAKLFRTATLAQLTRYEGQAGTRLFERSPLGSLLSGLPCLSCLSDLSCLSVSSCLYVFLSVQCLSTQLIPSSLILFLALSFYLSASTNLSYLLTLCLFFYGSIYLSNHSSCLPVSLH